MGVNTEIISTIEDLEKCKVWLGWRYEKRDKKPTKVPYSTSGRQAKTNDSETWDSFENASNMLNNPNNHLDGLGFVIPKGLVVIDIDNHSNESDNPLRQDIIQQFCDTYTEFSPSGKGNHVVFKIDLNRVFPNGMTEEAVEDFKRKYYMKNTKLDIEAYVGGVTNRFMTFTEECISSNHDIADMTDTFFFFLNNYMKRPEYVEPTSVTGESSTHKSLLTTSVGNVYRGNDIEAQKKIDGFLKEMKQLKESGKAYTIEKLLELAKKDEMFKDIYENGNYTKYPLFFNEKTQTQDHSEADLWLCKKLVRYLFPCYGIESVDRAFRNSGLYREKWERVGYREKTLNKALEHRFNGIKSKEKDENGNYRKSYFFGMCDRILNEDGTTREIPNDLEGSFQEKKNADKIIIEELTSESIFEERVFLLLLGMKDKIKRTRTEQQLSKQAEKLGVRKDFEQLLKTYKEVEKENAEKKKKKTRKEPFTIEALEEELEQRKITLKHNNITNQLSIFWNNKDFQEEDKESTLPTLLRSQLCDKYLYCSKDSIYDYLSFIAKKNRFNPVLDVLNANKWDKKDRTQELFEILHLKEDDKLSRTLIIKWLWQGLALLENSIPLRIEPQGVLTLTGKQGLGKTTFFKGLARLSDDCLYFQDGMKLDNYDKDFERRCVTTWITELGELDTTFKSDIGALKAFLTRPIDNYRLPYARTDETVPRRTNICATVNGDYFLIDQTGNRRFWTVPVTEIDINRIKEFDSLQLWEQIKEQYYLKNKLGFFLTKEEQDDLEKRNNKAMKPTKGQEEVADIISRIKESPKYVLTYMTVTEFQSQHRDVLGRYTVNQLGVALTALGYPKINKRIDGVPTYCRELPSLEGVPFKETDKKKNFYNRA